MAAVIKGGCLCGLVTFEVVDEFKQFHLCHCTQCRKITGSAHASNLFIEPSALTWTCGEDKLKRFDYPGRGFTKVFCTECGSGLPFLTQSGKYIIVPAGSLDGTPSLAAQDNIFCSEKAAWYEQALLAKHFDKFPE